MTDLEEAMNEPTNPGTLFRALQDEVKRLRGLVRTSSDAKLLAEFAAAAFATNTSPAQPTVRDVPWAFDIARAMLSEHKKCLKEMEAGS